MFPISIYLYKQLLWYVCYYCLLLCYVWCPYETHGEEVVVEAVHAARPALLLLHVADQLRHVRLAAPCTHTRRQHLLTTMASSAKVLGQGLSPGRPRRMMQMRSGRFFLPGSKKRSLASTTFWMGACIKPHHDRAQRATVPQEREVGYWHHRPTGRVTGARGGGG